MIKGEDELREAYRDQTVAQEYVARRFESPIGALLHARQAATVRNIIRKHAIQRAAEVAPGPARLTVDVLPCLPSVTLIDASAQMLREARRRLGERGLANRSRFVQADAFALPVGSQFDLVYSFRLIRHFEREDRLRLYGQIAGVLEPGGWFVFDAVNDVVSRPLRAQDRGEHRHFDALQTPGEIAQELQESGFEVASLTGVQHRYPLLQQVQVIVAPRSRWLARFIMELIERTGGQPLEWVVVCRRR